MEDNRRLMDSPTPMGNQTKEIELFHAYGEIIVDILKDTSFKEYEISLQEINYELPFGDHIWQYFKKNEKTFKIFTKRNLEIEEFDGDVKKSILNKNQYTKYINGIKRKKIGRTKDENEVDRSDRSYWNRQILFKGIIEENLMKSHKTGKGEYTYTTVDDVFNFFSGSVQTKSLISGKDLYKNFLNENGDYDFSISKDSIAKYINGIKRYFKKKNSF